MGGVCIWGGGGGVGYGWGVREWRKMATKIPPAQYLYCNTHTHTYIHCIYMYTHS